MNTAKIKKYAPLARNVFITAVTIRANELGIYDSHIEQAITEGQVLKIEGRSVDLKLKGARNKLIKRVASMGFKPLMEHVAYTWFNRLCAIRYMELHDYLGHGLRVLSHPENNSGFEILEHAQDVAEGLGLNRDQIIELKLAGNQDELLYRTLLLGQCHALHKAMPFLFEAIDDETELLLPDNLTRTDSILRGLVNDIPAEDWEQVEVIGWLYQFYISEKKDQVIGKVVKSEDIPAATQLFTPNWIVKYLVQNSVGRQWLQTYPDSSIKTGMDYYIEPAEQTDEVNAQIKAITPDSIEPESIKVLDPACGSGHILVEAYQVLKAIYEERGYQPRKIPQLILENNLFGLDIDDRAAQLAGFALMMLARVDDKRIFTRDVQLNVMAMQEAGEEVSIEGVALSSEEQETALLTLLDLFANAKTFGSLIQVPDALAKKLPELHLIIEEQIDSPDIFAQHTAKVLLPLIKQAEILARKYDAVVANPPYMGGKGMNAELKAFAKKQFPDSKSDLFAMFMERAFDLLKASGYNAQVNMQSWMFLSSYEKFRERLLEDYTLEAMVHMTNGVMGIAFGTAATIFNKRHIADYQGHFSYVRNEDLKDGVPYEFPIKNERLKVAKPDDFKKIPSSPIAYWVSNQVILAFSEYPNLTEYLISREGLTSGDNARFLKIWSEVDINKVCFNASSNEDAKKSGMRWFAHLKGGEYRKWAGNAEFIVDWINDGQEMKNFTDPSTNRVRSHNYNGEWAFKTGLTWSSVSAGNFCVRHVNGSFMFDTTGTMGFAIRIDILKNIESYLNSKVTTYLMKILAPTMRFQPGDVLNLPYKESIPNQPDRFGIKCIEFTEDDWNTYETSWDFQNNPLIVGRVSDSVTRHIEAENVGLRDKAANPSYEFIVPTLQRGNAVSDAPASRNAGALSDAFPRQSVGTIKAAFAAWQTHNRATILEMQCLEQENNRLFIDAYGLQGELKPDVPLEQITLTVNPKYRYGGNLSDADLNNRFQSDTLAELISYAIGCMMGRYSLDKAGLVYAHSGNVDFDTIYRSHAPRGNAAFDAQRPETENHASTQDNTLASHDAERLEMHSHAEHGNDNVSGANETDNPTFAPDDDGIIPLTDQEWFADDATHRFREFIRVVWGEGNLQQNLDFVAESLCLHAIKAKSGESSLEIIRRYLSTQFYKDHLKTYKKRPIYWLFSSGKQKAFECLVYLHRYNESTLSRMRTEYVTPLLGKYEASAMVLEKQMQEASTTAESNRFKKSLTALEKKQSELSEFDDQLKHTADMRINLDLDDGVKVNYGKFGDLLAEVKAVTGNK